MTESLAEAFNEGGFWMYPILLLGCALWPTSIALVVVAIGSKVKTRAFTIAVALAFGGLLPALLGALGYLVNLHAIDEALVHVSELDRETIRMAGRGEALATVQLGLSLSILPAMCGCGLLGLGLANLLSLRRATPTPAPSPTR